MLVVTIRLVAVVDSELSDLTRDVLECEELLEIVDDVARAGEIWRAETVPRRRCLRRLWP